MNEALKGSYGVVGLCPLRLKRARVVSRHRSASNGALFKMRKENNTLTHALTDTEWCMGESEWWCALE